LDLVKENLRGLIKRRSYSLKEMVPSVAVEYGVHKGVNLDMDLEASTVWILEVGPLLLPIQENFEGGDLAYGLNFDIFEIHQGDYTELTLGFSQDIKALKKVYQRASGFKIAHFIAEAGLLSEEGLWVERGQDFFDYYKEFLKGVIFYGDEALEAGVNEVYQDPFVYGDKNVFNPKIGVRIPFSETNCISLLKSLIKIPKMLEFSFYCVLEGKWKANELFSLVGEALNEKLVKGSQKRLKLEILDSYEREIPLVDLVITKKYLDLTVDVVATLTLQLLLKGCLYPVSFPRPKQIAVVGDVEKSETLKEAKRRARLTGFHAFRWPSNKALTSKEAALLQIDESLEVDRSSGELKIRDFKLETRGK